VKQKAESNHKRLLYLENKKKAGWGKKDE